MRQPDSAEVGRHVEVWKIRVAVVCLPMPSMNLGCSDRVTKRFRSESINSCIALRAAPLCCVELRSNCSSTRESPLELRFSSSTS